MLLAATGAFLATVAIGGWHGSGAPFLLVVPVWILARRRRLRAALPVAGTCALVAWLFWEAGTLRQLNLTLLLAFAVVAGLDVRAARRGGGAAEQPPEPAPASAGGPLTTRERDVLRLLATGHTNKEAAARLNLSVRTVESHRARIVDKLDCAGRSDLFRHACALGLVTGVEPDAR